MKTVEEIFEKQLEKSIPLTQEHLDRMEGGNYHSGEPYKVGDTLLWGLFTTEESDNVQLSTLELKEFGTVYELGERHTDLADAGRGIPMLQPKTST